MQSEEGECMSPEPGEEVTSSAEVKSAGLEDELDFEGDVPAEGPDRNKSTTSSVTREAESETGEDGEVVESEEGQREEGEEEDLEEGELKEEEDNELGAAGDVCKYYSRGSCTWGDGCRFQHQPPAGRRINVPPLRPPAAPLFAPAAVVAQPMAGLKGPAPRPFFQPPALLPTPTISDAMASSWERGLRSAKERLAKAKERKETEIDLDDKRLNLTTPDEVIPQPHRNSSHSSNRHLYSSRDYTSSSGRDRRSPGDRYSSSSYSYHSSSSSHQYYSSSSSHNYQSRDYRNSHSQQSHDESEYERRQRLAYMSAPRPEEWNDRGQRTRPVLLDRYGREIQRCSRPDDYTDRWRRSPVTRVPDKPVRESGDLSSISTSDSPSGLSGTSDSDSDGSWSDEDHDRKKVNHRSKGAVVVNPEVKVAPTASSGMKRIPRLSDRQPMRDRVSPKRPELSRSDVSYSSKTVMQKDRGSSRSYRSSFSSGSGEELDASKVAEKRKGQAEQYREGKRRRESHLSNGSNSPVAPISPATREFSPSDSGPLSPRREKERFHMDFVGKSQRLRPTDVAETLNRASSVEDAEEEEDDVVSKRSGSAGENSVDKAAERKKLLEQLKAVEAAIAAKKQPLKMSRRKN